MKIRHVGPSLVISFDHLPFQSDLRMMSEVKAKKSKDSKTFTAPGMIWVVNALRRRYPNAEYDTSSLDRGDSPITIDEFSSGLFPYQQGSLDRLSRAQFGYLLALSPGLGKSAVSIRAADRLRSSQVLIVSPLTLVRNWKAQIEQWSILEGEIEIIRDSHQKEISPNVRWVLTNYEMMVRNPLFDRSWPLIIFDESILLKSRDSLRSRKALEIAIKSQRRWLLSGSPISRSADDLFQQFRLIRPDVFTSFWRFAEEYCIVERGTWGTTILGSKPSIDYRQEFGDIFEAVARDEVLDLPPETHERIEVDLFEDQIKVANRLIDEFILESNGKDLPVSSKVAQITRLLQVSSNLATVDPSRPISAKATLLEHMIREKELPVPTIVWVHFKESMSQLFLRLSLLDISVDRLASEMSPEERQRTVDRFQNGEIDVLIASLGVGKYGLTLTRAQSYVYHDRSFDADAIVQSSFRVSRIGLDHPVTAITLASPIDRLVDDNLSGKLPSIGQISGTNWTKLLESLRC